MGDAGDRGFSGAHVNAVVMFPKDRAIDEDLLRDMVTCTTDGMTSG